MSMKMEVIATMSAPRKSYLMKNGVVRKGCLLYNENTPITEIVIGAFK
jgi:hypothetical protein